MFFLLSKILSILIQPLFWLGLWWVAALLLLRRRRKVAVAMLWCGIGTLGLLGFQALPDALLRPLENHYTAPKPATLSKYTGVIVLGGAIGDPASYMAHSQVPLSEAAERLVESANLIRTYPNLRLVFSGGEGRLLARGTSEAELAKSFYRAQGLDMSRIRLESHARNTRENAQLTSALIGAECHASWLLMTSAAHMPRAMSEFEAAGCRVTPYPVDYLTSPTTPLTDYSLTGSLFRWQVALHEWIGLAVYHWTK